jgi:hypothetical protein
MIEPAFGYGKKLLSTPYGFSCIILVMKASDDYRAKYLAWAGSKEIYALSKLEGIPAFSARKFSSYEEFNRWKRNLLVEIASRGGVTWTK